MMIELFLCVVYLPFLLFLVEKMTGRAEKISVTFSLYFSTQEDRSRVLCLSHSLDLASSSSLASSLKRGNLNLTHSWDPNPRRVERRLLHDGERRGTLSSFQGVMAAERK